MPATPPPITNQPQDEKLPFLLKLLDDEQPEVRQIVSTHFSQFGGDLSDSVASSGILLSAESRTILSDLLLPARREALRRDWFTPSRELAEPDGDWELFEAFLRMISDYLHDGVSLRPSLSDLLDDLAEESADHELDCPVRLADWLFKGRLLGPNKRDYYNPKNSDLAHVLITGQGNPLSLSIILILVAQRRSFPVYGCNYPGHFLCWTDTFEGPLIIDPYNKGRTLTAKKILASNPGLPQLSRSALDSPASQIDMLRRLLSNLGHAFDKNDSTEDTALIKELSASLNECDHAAI